MRKKYILKPWVKEVIEWIQLIGFLLTLGFSLLGIIFIPILLFG